MKSSGLNCIESLTKTDASTTRRPVTPLTVRSGLSAPLPLAVDPERPIATVPDTWFTTSAFARILNADARVPGEPKFVDVWRKRHPDLRHYTYFSYRFNCREKGIGWRLDMCTYTHPLLSPLFL